MSAQPIGRLTTQASGEEVWQIEGLQTMSPFLVSVISAHDHWMFVSTSGGLTAGRQEPSRSLFPYETDDRLHHAAGITGPITLIRTATGELWHPFDPRGLAPGRVRTLRKSALGHWLELEEHAPDLGLRFRYRWSTSRRFGLVRTCALEGEGTVEVLDGLLNVLPANVPMLSQQGMSALVDAYKRCELEPSGLAIYAMEARLSDRAAPAESLRANVVWRIGLPGATHLCADVVADMREGRSCTEQPLQVGRRGAYLVRTSLDLSEGPARWTMVGDVHLDQAAVEDLQAAVADDPEALRRALEVDVADGARDLARNVASADSQQHTADVTATVHHTANVLFNNMRGGVFGADHEVPTVDLAAFVRERNRAVFARHTGWLGALDARLDHPALISGAEATGDPQLVRLCLEYLPLTFSRRHGDPSRPWNQFRIDNTHPDGTPRYGYEGNWRDIFQNWEALLRSFPAFGVAGVCKFVNASTVDGFNPYRLTRQGVDWEVPEPENPWSNIGYWGDHQIVYLFQLIGSAEAHDPGSIQRLLGVDWFSTAAVPYRIRPYAELCENAQDTIVFDESAQRRSMQRVQDVGGDGRLLSTSDGEVWQVNLLEKLLICVLAKLSNLVVDGGIWLNTQRPEWNDANNALVGQGLSVVTLAQLRRALTVLVQLMPAQDAHPVSQRVTVWLREVHDALRAERPALAAAGSQMLGDDVRRRLMDRLGEAFSDYRAAAYAEPVPSAPRQPVSGASLAALCTEALAWVDHTLRTNRRSDGLFHSYNLLDLTDSEARVSRLYEMLEGQVAVLASGLLSATESVALVDALFDSRMYRPDQDSFMLYPRRDRAPFLARNVIDEDVLAGAPLLRRLAEATDARVVCRTASGTWRFQADFANAEDLAAALDRVGAEPAWREAVAEGRDAVLAAYEAVFHHHAFTGRSGTMHKYEGLGSIYWHMVGKLLVAVQDTWWRARRAGADAAVLGALAQRYHRVRGGLCFRKSVAEYGAVPTDPYSHTPWGQGAQQPGMTGQVKEVILTRLGELGVWVEEGCLTFAPGLLDRAELLTEPAVWPFLGHGGETREVAVPAGSVALSVAQVPVVITMGRGASSIEVHRADGQVLQVDGAALDVQTTASVLGRQGVVREVRVRIA
ncbi:MAG: hypothetical protein KTR31_20935 [Myxococcales bacterium]|nr:hypothetical protein [Myxococcales bacterium]